MRGLAILFAAAAVAALAAGARGAEPRSAEALAQASGCIACHSVGKKLVGPGYREIANRYRNEPGAEEALVKKVKTGGKGVWGDIPMAPNAHVRDEDIRTIVRWILSLK